MAASGYTRQAAANIQPNLPANAQDVNAEFNALANAFDNAAGHDHSGSVTGDGQKISLSAGVTGVLPQANGGTGSATVFPAVNPNKFLNPFMEIDQANEGVAITVASGTSAYAIDGWKAFNIATGTTIGVGRVADSPTGYSSCVSLTMAAGGAQAAGTVVSLQQPIEADDIGDTQFGTASAQSLTLTLWVKASLTGTYSVSVRNGAGTRSYVFNITLTANTWTKITQTIPGDVAGTWVISGNAAGMTVDVVAACGATFQTTPGAWQAGNFLGTSSTITTFASTNGATLRLGPSKLEVGLLATSLLRNSIQEELTRCQRYLEKSYNLGTALQTVTTVGASQVAVTGLTNGANTAFETVYFRTSKRATPTITMLSPATGATGVVRDQNLGADVAASGSSVGQNGFVWAASGSGASTIINLQGHWLADARL